MGLFWGFLCRLLILSLRVVIKSLLANLEPRQVDEWVDSMISCFVVNIDFYLWLLPIIYDLH